MLNLRAREIYLGGRERFTVRMLAWMYDSGVSAEFLCDVSMTGFCQSSAWVIIIKEGRVLNSVWNIHTGFNVLILEIFCF